MMTNQFNKMSVLLSDEYDLRFPGDEQDRDDPKFCRYFLDREWAWN